jgi:hypothetical protein
MPDAGMGKASVCWIFLKSVILLVSPILHDEIQHIVTDKAEMKAKIVPLSQNISKVQSVTGNQDEWPHILFKPGLPFLASFPLWWHFVNTVFGVLQSEHQV